MQVLKGKCGTDCNECEFKDKFSCGGCKKQNGNIFWGQCDVFICAKNKGHMHCGKCTEFPCEDLIELIENGHNLNRLQNIKKWNNEDMIQSRCGLICSNCSFRESHNCGGCKETNGHPFYGECSVAICCQDKGFMHCGECENIPKACNIINCKNVNEEGFYLCEVCEKTTCGKLHAYSYTDPTHGDNPPGARVEQCLQWIKLSNK